MRGARLVEPTRLGLRDLAGEAIAAMLGRPGRAALTVVGTLLGVAAFVAVLGLTTTASGQISKRFTALAATEVTLEANRPSAGEPAAPPAFPVDTDHRLEALNGVKHAGVFWTVPGPGPVAGRQPGPGESGEDLTVLAASPGYLPAIHARLASGRWFDDWHDQHRQRVAVLGSGLARRLGITRVDVQPAIFIGQRSFTVIGIIADVDRRAETLLSVVVPAQTAWQLWPTPPTADAPVVRAVIDTELGAAQLVGRQAPYALRPEEPDRFTVTVPPDPHQLKDAINTDLATLFLVLAGVCLVIGAVGIANTTLVAVLERIGEIGLRRSLGARRRHIAAQFLAESGMLGLVGGLVGTSLGVATVVVIAVVRDWTPILRPDAVLPAPFAGAAIGLVAGLYPAWRAARIEPVDAIRR